MKFALITLVGLTCVTIIAGDGSEELASFNGAPEARSLGERGAVPPNLPMMPMMPMRPAQPSMAHVMGQLETMKKQMEGIQTTLRRNHTRRSSINSRSMQDVMSELDRNMKSLQSRLAELSGRSLRGMDQQTPFTGSTASQL